MASNAMLKLKSALDFVKKIESFKLDLVTYVCKLRQLDPKTYANEHAEVKITNGWNLVVSLWREIKEEPASFDKYRPMLDQFEPRRDYFIWEYSTIVSEIELCEFLGAMSTKHPEVFK